MPSSSSNQSSRPSNNIDHQTNNNAMTTTTRSSSSSSSSVIGTTTSRPNKSSSSSSSSSFVYLATGARHSIGIAVDGSAYSWGRSNEVGQLGRDTDLIRCKKVGPILMNNSNNTNQNNNVTAVKFVKAYVSQGSTTGAGHSALLDTQGRLWMVGCDRWQQLGLGAAPAGGGTSNGYTWKNGKLWQDRFVLFEQVTDMMRNRNRNREDRKDDNNNRVHDEEEQNRASSHYLIRDVALGGDHTLLLSSNQRDVYAFGKGGDGQLGLVGCPYVSAPIKSKGLSLSSSSKTTSSMSSLSSKNHNEENTNTNNNNNTSNTNTNNDSMIHAICAIQNCSLTLDMHGNVKDRVGKCRTMEVEKGLQECRSRAIREGLLLVHKVVAPATTTTVHDRS